MKIERLTDEELRGISSEANPPNDIGPGTRLLLAKACAELIEARSTIKENAWFAFNMGELTSKFCKQLTAAKAMHEECRQNVLSADAKRAVDAFGDLIREETDQ